MCRVLGKEFVPYLPGVIPPLVDLAGAKADIQLLDDEEQMAKVQQEDGWELVPLKGKIVGIRTTALEEKHNAIEVLVVYAQTLEAAFEPYVVDIMDNVALPGLTFFFHESVRAASAKLVPQLLNAYKMAHGDAAEPLVALWRTTIEKVLEVLATEPSVETLAEMYQCLYESVEVMGSNMMTDDEMAAFIEAARSTLEDYQTRVRARQEELQNNAAHDGSSAGGDGSFAEEAEYDDPEQMQIAIEDDQTLLSDMNKAFHTIFKHQGAAFLPYWERLLPFYTAFVTSADATQRQWSLCILDDVLEFCGAQSWRYSDHIIQPLLDGLRDPIAGNRQAACYGVGVAAQRGGEAWAGFAAHSIPLLFQAAQRPDAREEDHVYATENACASIARVLMFNSSKVEGADRIIEHWLDTLPIVNDTEVAVYAYTFLARLIEQ
jgi:hypothetical protein